ncbi:protein of unknown function [Nitrospira japonica]|uniref:Tetratricopeptide repeat protein n=1 Tax=Nitrospira japonica TaxID=1325564 RepID=A0A1W1I2C0_9BACT|nr:tetratricopeptide repeat protein [Nitrospira japonica]SLM47009.1 protein of unknown function [Nitrospira japonica]
MRTDKRTSHKTDKKPAAKGIKGVVGYSKKSALLEEAITHMNAGKYGRSSASLKELLALDPQNMEARRLFATLHLRLGSLVTAREAFESLANEAIGRQDYWLAESLLREYLAAGPRCIPFLELLAHVYEEKGDAMAAVAELGKAVEILLEDPDPDHPQKPSQLYGRIRELAPASLVAFQFASSFDIQTGEFRRQPREVEPPRGGEEISRVETATFSDRTDSSVEVMPWEHLEEPVAPASSAAGSPFDPPVLDDHPAASIPEPRVADVGEHIAESELSPPAPVAVPIQTPDIASGWSVTPMDDLAADEAVVDESLTTSDRLPEASSLPMAPLDESDHGFAQASLSAPESVYDLTDSAASIDASMPEPETLLSRMPWEHVADAGLQIVEPEPPPVADELVVTESSFDEPVLPESEPALPPAVPIESSSVLLPPSDEYRDPIEQRDLAAAETTVQPAESKTESSPTPTPSSPLSFSWNAIFDSAWKIAAGTTAPSTPDMAKESELTSPSMPDSLPLLQQRESSESSEEPPASHAGGHAVELSVPEPPPEFSIEPAPHPLPPSSDALWPSTDPEPLETPSTSFPSSPERDESRPVEELRTLSSMDTDSLASSAAIGDPIVEAQDMSRVPLDPAQSDAAPSMTPPEFRLASGNETSPDASDPAPVPDALLNSTAPDAPITDVTSESMMPSSDMDPRWSTGEVAVQHHRPTIEKKKWEAPPAVVTEPPRAAAEAESLIEPVSELSRGWEAPGSDEAVAAVLPAPVVEEVVPPPQDMRPEWAQASDAIVLEPSVDQTPVTPLLRSESVPSVEEPGRSPVAAAVDALFGSTGQSQPIHTMERTTPPRSGPRWSARLSRLRFTVVSLIGSSFSTTRAFAVLCLSLGIFGVVVLALGVGLLAVSWIAMEEAPTPRYQALTAGPQRTITDPKNNGFLLLLGFDTPSDGDPLKAGYERKPGEQDVFQSQVCASEQDVTPSASGGSSPSSVVGGWFKSANPVAQAKAGSDVFRSLLAKEATALSRYQQFMGMPFDDWGFGQILSPNCAHILLTHRLYLMEGFNQDVGSGVTRLEKDMESWRTVLGQSKTLMMKMLAVGAVQDDVRLASSVLTRPEADATVINRLSKIVRPLDQLELSVRWPMQSQFVWATGRVPADLEQYAQEDHPLYLSMAAAMPLPVQRRANAYADYYEAANKAVAEGRYVNLPKRSQFVRTSATSIVDYWANPLEHIVGIDPLPSWEPYVGRMVETDAQLRLASLQVWVRRGPQEGDVMTRLAKAGQAYYDPFTGFPMLVNQERRLLYSVGRDGRDQGGDPAQDVVVAISSLQPAGESKRASR